MALKAITTHYNGRKFRSRLEARWGVFFDYMGWDYEYEQEGFVLQSGPYLPDFYFRNFNLYAEVKAAELNAKELLFCKDLSNDMDTESGSIDVLILEGAPKNKSYRTIIDGDIGTNVLLLSDQEKFFPLFSSDEFIDQWTFLDRTKYAVKMANEYRFEHGEGLK